MKLCQCGKPRTTNRTGSLPLCEECRKLRKRQQTHESYIKKKIEKVLGEQNPSE